MGALYALKKNKSLDVNSFPFSLYREYVNHSEKLPLLFLIACAVNCN